MSRRRPAHALTTPAAPLSKDVAGLAAILLASGAAHLIRPRTYEAIIPTPLASRSRELVLASGVAELACGAALLHPRTRKVAGLASAALLVGVLPANIQMSADQAKRAQRKQDAGSTALFAGTLARLPLQWPMIRTALRAAGRL
ncbi:MULTISPECIES: DoxX family protein [unclassified Janibacter]|uniref:DoxX family protein n=1 Tax=unclassified Janibacter TaxID=2649294 RepID=UPI003CFD5190